MSNPIKNIAESGDSLPKLRGVVGYEAPGAPLGDAAREEGGCNFAMIVEKASQEYLSRRGSLSPLSIERSRFREIVWAHMDPLNRNRLCLEDFEEQLNANPSKDADRVRPLDLVLLWTSWHSFVDLPTCYGQMVFGTSLDTIQQVPSFCKLAWRDHLFCFFSAAPLKKRVPRNPCEDNYA